MTELSPENRGFFWSVLFFRSLFDHGVSQVIISPGSRSTPLTLAAASHPGFRTRVILDERSAAFTALGIGKATGIPAVLICTSGTAAANYYPAVIESRLSGVPLILATADRPPHLRNTGANQTIDQFKLFGDYPVFSHEVGEPLFEDDDVSRLTMLARQAVHWSVSRKGPAHLNFPFRKPLEPDTDFLGTIERENASLLNKQNSVVETSSSQTISLSDRTKHVIQQASRPLIVVGPLANLFSAVTIEQLAESIMAPVLSEGGFTGPNAIHGCTGFLRNDDVWESLRPNLILRFGFQPTDKAIELALKAWKHIPHFHFASTDAWHDATFTATQRIDWLERPVDWSLSAEVNPTWLDSWKARESEFSQSVTHHLSQEATLSDLHVYHHLTPQIPESWSVFLSNSFPIRDSQLAGRYRTSSLYSNRGASGIDGITSTALGVCLATDQPVVLFTGDLAFLHDTNALLSQKLLNRPMIVVVLNNNGGNIFRMLPVAKHRSYYSTYFETPQSADLYHMANTYGLPYAQVSDLEALKKTNLHDIAGRIRKGFFILECKTDSEASMNLREKFWSGNHAS
jgi:2-succinyl-5-enolpyruvyl-6-hydroxy-3-cyclohexene-1-carboxylate synthase